MSESATASETHSIRRVAILFAGGPAPAANAVISTAAASFLRNGIHVTGILHGYSNLIKFGPENPMQIGPSLSKSRFSILKANSQLAGDPDWNGA